jgi:hypothetical protein
LGKEVEISTGLGGGDCGARFPPGLTFLIYAYRSTPLGLSISMCSPGGWIGDDRLATDLRYLRHEPPIPSDLEPVRHSSVNQSPKEQQLRRDRYEELMKRYSAVSGKICGTIIRDNERAQNPGILSFLAKTGYSPVDNPIAEINQDGSFCSPPLGPGQYYVFFLDASDERVTSTAYFAGATNRTEATPIDVRSGQTVSKVAFKIPPQKAHSVGGLISIDEKSELKDKRVTIGLIRVDGGLRHAWYSQTVNFDGFFPFPKVRYFAFDDVLPGDYIAVASVDGTGWFTKKVEVRVKTHMKFIFVELVHKK